jgi:hypothetical protein
MKAWSYSVLKTFTQCARKYFHLKVAKDIVEKESEDIKYGNRLHKAAELYISKGTELPTEFLFLKPALDQLNKIPGTKYCEVKLGLSNNNGELAECEFFARNVWWRGLADLVVVNGELGYSLDYKTGKSSRYADETQLDIVAVGLFHKFPKLNKIKSALFYTAIGEMIKKTHVRDNIPDYLEQFEDELYRFEEAHKLNVWNPNPTPLCGWCPVTTCEHHQ